ncbi:hypothetical protein KQX54_008174, partial [Cotesia glomerata]
MGDGQRQRRGCSLSGSQNCKERNLESGNNGNAPTPAPDLERRVLYYIEWRFAGKILRKMGVLEENICNVVVLRSRSRVASRFVSWLKIFPLWCTDDFIRRSFFAYLI